MDILIATRNPGKFKEISSMLASTGATFYSPADLKIEEDFDETGETYEANALGKARFYGKRAPEMIVVADDSGIVIEAIQNELGVKTRRWGAGHDASDEEWLDYFMHRMESEENRRAHFIGAAALKLPDGTEEVFIGETSGEILRELMVPVKPGIPLSSVFLADGFEKVYAALSDEEKNEISHRGKAVAQVLTYLNTHLNG